MHPKAVQFFFPDMNFSMTAYFILTEPTDMTAFSSFSMNFQTILECNITDQMRVAELIAQDVSSICALYCFTY